MDLLTYFGEALRGYSISSLQEGFRRKILITVAPRRRALCTRSSSGMIV